MTNHRWTAWCAASALLLALATPVQAQRSIVDTVHNLSASGPGPYTALTESEICIFCHTPHRSRTNAPLWNREDSRETYLTYSSSTFEGDVTQPTGGSKLCLSCHDGSIALGAVVSLGTDIEMKAGLDKLDQGPGFIGTNLADDHPVSFHYASSGANSGAYVHASAIPAPVHLDTSGNMECTSCHDSHNNSLGDFLHVTDRNSQLCLACHAPGQWDFSAHARSDAIWNGVSPDPWPNAKYGTVAENGCANCHTMHGARHPQRLMTYATEEDGCLNCHNANVASTPIERDLYKPFRHDPYITQDIHDPTENPLTMPRHAECEDCHDPHAATAGSVPAPGVPGPLNLIDGINAAGQPIREINYGYELCYKCHADNTGGTIHVPRQIVQDNTRLEFAPGNPSYHPIEVPGTNPDVPSLLPTWTTASIMSCGDCHTSDDDPAFGGMGSAGPHGSIYEPLLGARYMLQDGYPESPSSYALCYRCHSRSSILSDASFPFHELHVVRANTSCSACHDPHGISASQGNPVNNSHLMNFDVSVVTRSPTTNQLFFQDDGYRKGTCMLACHGVDHAPSSY